MSRSLVSVIIPTRNRQFYAEKSVRQIVGMGKDIEVIVQDNSDDDSLYHALKNLIKTENVKYQYEKEVLPFSENYDRAANMATGEFLCAIGDDDGILPDITDCALWMKKHQIDLLKPSKNQFYFYPGNVNRRKSACMGIGSYTGTYYYSNPETAVISLLDSGGGNYLDKDLTGSYHGLVSIEAMKKVKNITGKFYAGLTPDMYSVICLSLLPQVKFAAVDYPISLPGICPVSGSAASDIGKHAGKLEDAPHLKVLPDYHWSKYVPKFYSVETIWAETMIYAIIKMGREELIEKYFNYERLAASMYLNNKAYRDDILKILPAEIQDYVSDSFYNNAEVKRNIFCRAMERVAIKLSGKRKTIRNVSEINSAVNILCEELYKAPVTAPWDR